MRRTHSSNIVKSTQLYALGQLVTNWLDMPGKVHVYWKDIKGFYLGANDFMTKVFLQQSPIGTVGYNDEEMVSANAKVNKLEGCEEILAQHNVWLNNDNLVLTTGKTLSFYNYVVGIDKYITVLTHKTPLYDMHGEIVGTFGFSFYMSEKKLSFFKNITELKENIANFTELTQNLGAPPAKIILNNAILSRRETACAFYLAKGFSAKQIAIKLGISSRTVQTHLDHIKEKTGCKFSSELVEQLFDKGFF